MSFLDIFSFLIIIFGCIIGYRLGLRASLYRLGCFFIFVLGGFLISHLFASLLFNVDFSFLNIKISELRLRTIPGFLRTLTALYFPDITDYINDAHYLNLLIEKLAKAILKVPFFLFWVICMVPVLDALFYKKMLVSSNRSIKDRISAALVGLLQGIALLVLFFSPLNGIMNLKKTISEKKSINKVPIVLKLSGNFVFDWLFQTHYKKEEIIFRKDIEKFINLQNEEKDPKKILTVFEDLETTEILGPALLEIYLLSKNVSVDNVLLKDLKTIPYRKEIKNINQAYRLYLRLDLENLSEKDADIIKELAAYLSDCRLLDIVCPYLLVEYFPEYTEYLGDVFIKEIVWTRELKIFSELYELFLGLQKDASWIFRYSEEEISNAIRLLFQSELFKRNVERWIDIYIEKFLPKNLHNLQLKEIKEKEINNTLLFVGFLNENGFFREDFSLTKFLNDTNIDKMVAYISDSELLIANLNQILPLIFSKSSFKISSFVVPVLNWKSASGKQELRSFFEFLRIFSDEEKYQKEVLYYTDVFLVKRKISDLVSLNGEAIFSYLLSNLFGKGFSLRYQIDWKSEAGNLELLNLIKVYRELVRTGLLYSNKLDGISDEDIFALGEVLFDSKLFVENFNVILEYLLYNASPTFAVSIGFDSGLITDEDIIDLLFALRALDGINDEDDILKLNIEEIDTALNSRIISSVFKQYLSELKEAGKLVIDFPDEDEIWEAEMRNLILGLKRINEKNKNFGFKNLNLNIIYNLTTGNIGEDTDDLALILKSKILTSTFISNIKKLEKDRNSGEGIFIIDLQEDDWFDKTYPNYRPGELRYFVRGIQIIYRALKLDLNNPVIHREKLKEISAGMKDTNGDGKIDDSDDNELREIIRSKILADTIIFLLYEEIVS